MCRKMLLATGGYYGHRVYTHPRTRGQKKKVWLKGNPVKPIGGGTNNILVFKMPML